MSAPRILLAKPGLDGHDRGVKVIAMALRDAGAEVIYLGLRRSPSQIVSAAVDEGADVIGISVLSGAHLALSRDLIEERARVGADDIPIVVGGTVPAADEAALRGIGVADVYPVGTPLDAVVEGLLAQAADGERT